jgi:selenophosphate synthetase-related protein
VMCCVKVDGMCDLLCESGWYVTVCCVKVDGMCDVLCEGGRYV